MPNPLIDFSQTIRRLNNERRFSEALKYFKDNKLQFTDEEIKSNSFLLSAMIDALRHTNNISAAFKFLEKYRVQINNDTQEIILKSYGWLLYDKYKLESHLNDINEVHTEAFDDDELSEVKHNEITKSDTVKLIESFIPLIIKFDNDYAYSVVSKLFNIVPKVEKKKANANWRLVNEYCDLFPIDNLRTSCEKKEVERKGRMVEMEFASDKENWFAYKSKALMKLGLFQECYDISNHALGTFQSFHYSNDVWFARRIALSKKQLGNSQNAIQELQQILKRKREWFIQKELAELYKEANDIENAFKYAIEAINNFGDIEYKVDLLFLIGELLTEKQQQELAFKHYSLSRLIRISEEWKIPSKLSSALSQFKLNDIPIERMKELKSELKKYWNSFNQKPGIDKSSVSFQSKKQSGKIEKVLHNDERGADGFIKCEESKSIYFKVNPNEEIKTKLVIGLEVEFKILPATPEKKEKAVNLKVKTK